LYRRRRKSLSKAISQKEKESLRKIHRYTPIDIVQKQNSRWDIYTSHSSRKNEKAS
jgi:hypothetical protein